MEAVRILFQGDSITDAGRDRTDPHHLGEGYVKYAAEWIQNRHPGRKFEFLNLGISGNRAENLRERWEEDCIAYRPDVVSILIGINDTWHRAEHRNWMPHDYFEACYRFCLEELKQKTKAKIILLEQFLLPVPDKEFFRCDLDPKIQITRKLAREYADIYLPLDGMFAARCVKEAPAAWAADGVHPTVAGARQIAEQYADAFDRLFASISIN